MTAARMRAVVLAALVCGAAVVGLVLASDRQEAGVVWAIFGPAVVWSFVGTGLYAWRRRPESRIGALMVLLGFAWCVAALSFANSRLLYSFALVAGGLWGGVFLHLVMSFPSGRLAAGRDPRDRRRRLCDLHRHVDPGHVVRRPARARVRRLPGEPAADTARRRSGDRRSGPSVSALRRAVCDRARPTRAALAANPPTRAPPAHARLRLRAADVPARDRRHGRRRRRRLVGRVRRNRGAPPRLPGRAAAQPRRAPRRRTARTPGGTARLARPARCRPATPSGVVSSATCTMAPSRGWWPSQ